MELFILIDYDNLGPILKTKNLVYILDRIVATFSLDELMPFSHIQARLYGGWYKQGSNTKLAQDLSKEIITDFPRPKVITNPVNGIKLKLSMNVMLAFSLMITPSHHLLNTYRETAAPSGIVAKHPSSLGCTNTSCPLIFVYDFINNGMLRSSCCNIKLEQLLYRGEQKLVDTMINSDLIYICSKLSKSICVVSSDDDFWPGIETVVNMQASVYHIHTRNRTTPPHYLRGVSSLYKERVL
jgi:hypothetical protein